jgi:hypothetical protein
VITKGVDNSRINYVEPEDRFCTRKHFTEKIVTRQKIEKPKCSSSVAARRLLLTRPVRCRDEGPPRTRPTPRKPYAFNFRLFAGAYHRKPVNRMGPTHREAPRRRSTSWGRRITRRIATHAIDHPVRRLPGRISRQRTLLVNRSNAIVRGHLPPGCPRARAGARNGIPRNVGKTEMSRRCRVFGGSFREKPSFLFYFLSVSA